jgi:hypothetical protein
MTIGMPAYHQLIRLSNSELTTCIRLALNQFLEAKRLKKNTRVEDQICYVFLQEWEVRHRGYCRWYC